MKDVENHCEAVLFCVSVCISVCYWRLKKTHFSIFIFSILIYMSLLFLKRPHGIWDTFYVYKVDIIDAVFIRNHKVTRRRATLSKKCFSFYKKKLKNYRSDFHSAFHSRGRDSSVDKVVARWSKGRGFKDTLKSANKTLRVLFSTGWINTLMHNFELIKKSLLFQLLNLVNSVCLKVFCQMTF